MKTLRILCAFALLAISAQAQHLRVIVETTSLTRQLLTNDTSGEIVTLLFGTNNPLGITSIDGLTQPNQWFTLGTAGTDANWTTDSTNHHILNLPTATGTSRGLLAASDWTAFNNAAASNALNTTVTTNIAKYQAYLATNYLPVGMPALNGYSSNQFIIGATTYPSNISTFNFPIYGTNGGHYLIAPGGGFSGVKDWENIVGLNKDQYTIVTVSNGVIAYLFEPLGTNYNGVVGLTRYPNAMDLLDINGAKSGSIDNAGGLNVSFSGSYGLTFADTRYWPVTNAWRIHDTIQPGSSYYGCFVLTEAMPTANNADVMVIWPQAAGTYEQFNILPNGQLRLRYGLTMNAGETLQVSAPVGISTNTTIGGLLTLNNATNNLATSGSISSTSGAFTITNSTAWGPVPLGSIITVTNNQYTILATSGNVANVLESVQLSFTNYGGFNLKAPSAIWNNATPTQSGAVLSSGSLLLTAQSVNSPAIILSAGGDTHSTMYNYILNTGGHNYWTLASGVGGAPVLAVDTTAPYNSEIINSSGIATFGFGTTAPYFKVSTNAQTATLNMTQQVSDMAAGASFNWTGFTGLSTKNYDALTVYLTNTASLSGPITNGFPPNVHVQGTLVAGSYWVTNVSKVLFEVNAGRWTNATFTPLF